MNGLKGLEDKYDEIMRSIQSDKLSYNTENLSHIIGLSLHSRIMENVAAVVILLKKEYFGSAIYPILRNTLEAIIDLDNLANISGYTEYLAYLDSNRKVDLGKKEYVINLMKDKKEEYKTIQSKNKQLLENMKKLLKDNYEEIYYDKKNNRIHNSIWFKFKLSKSLDSYNTIYFILCEDSHNNLGSLERNYISEGREVSISSQITEEEINRNCETLMSILDDSIKIIRKIIQ